MIDVTDKKQMHDSIIMGKEYASKDWTCVISMFLTSFNVYFVYGCACFMCICLKTAICFFLAFVWGKVWLFWWRPVGNPVVGNPAAHLCSTARIRRDISAASFCSCKL